MPVNLPPIDPAQLHPVAGVRWGVTEAGVRKANRKDVSVMLLDEGASVAGVFTKNRFCAAPVQVCREHLQTGQGIRAMVINTGNANAGTGAPGLAHARQTCEAMAALLHCQPNQILPFSTGVIMETLPVDRIEAGLAGAIADLKADLARLPIEQLRSVPTRVIASGGNDKVECILGAIKLVNCNVLITNEAVAQARKTLAPKAIAIGSINSPMQCMMKGICAQCLCKHVEPETGKEYFVYSCYNQDQDLDKVDFPHLNARLRQNTVQEKLSNLWLDYLLTK